MTRSWRSNAGIARWSGAGTRSSRRTGWAASGSVSPPPSATTSRASRPAWRIPGPPTPAGSAPRWRCAAERSPQVGVHEQRPADLAELVQDPVVAPPVQAAELQIVRAELLQPAGADA